MGGIRILAQPGDGIGGARAYRWSWSTGVSRPVRSLDGAARPALSGACSAASRCAWDKPKSTPSACAGWGLGTPSRWATSNSPRLRCRPTRRLSIVCRPPWVTGRAGSRPAPIPARRPWWAGVHRRLKADHPGLLTIMVPTPSGARRRHRRNLARGRPFGGPAFGRRDHRGGD